MRESRPLASRERQPCRELESPFRWVESRATRLHQSTMSLRPRTLAAGFVWQAIFCRRRHQPRRPALAKIRPGSPAPAIGPGTGSDAVAVTVTLEIWPSLLAVPPLTILKKSEVPRSVNAGNVIVLKAEKFTLLPSCTKPAGPGPSASIRKLPDRIAVRFR
jgi:hypothetical protein